jgi:predicted nucleotidyltransferase
MATTKALIDSVKQSPFGQTMSIEHLIHLFEGGSALHGARLEGKSDLDVCGVFIEPKVNIFGLSPFEHLVTGTSDNSARNTNDDVDICLYGLRRWAELACKGNPTAISYMFAPNARAIGWSGRSYFSVWTENLLTLREAIISKKSAVHFMGFVDGQMKRLLNEKGNGKHGQRPELAMNFGYDTKAAMHAVRLCGEGIELMTTGKITLPRPNANELIQIRNGRWSLDYLSKTVSGLLYELEDAMTKSPLCSKPDRDIVNATLVKMYETFYGYNDHE